MLRFSFALIAFAAAAFGQAADAPAPSFDVASVKLGQPGGGSGERRGPLQNIQVSPGSVTMRGVNLKNCIRWAYHVTEFQVTGPDWLDSQRFEIAGKSAGPATEDQLRLMMQGLLQERFKLAFHRDTKVIPAYVLSVGKNGFKLQESRAEGEAVIEPNQKQLSVTIQHAPMSQLIDMLGSVLRAPIVDNTGLKGRYDATLNVAKYAADMAAQGKSVDMDPVNLIAMVLQEEFGLKLEPKKMPLELLIVDHAERAPVEN